MTKMKWMMTTLLLCATLQQARSQEGIYLSAADYRNNIMINGKVLQHDFFYDAPGLTVKTNGKATNYKKNEVYGFRTNRNEVYRFYRNAAYEIIEAGNIYIYSRKRNSTQGKGYVVISDHYFSNGATGAILPLTIENLSAVYSSNEKFLDLLVTNFADGNAARYDHVHKAYAVNYLYSKTIDTTPNTIK